jgi:hypothetical protein
VIEIYESYKAYVPPHWVRPTIERLLDSVGPEHVGGLRPIVLTDSASIGRGKARRVAGKRYERSACRGFYYQEWRGKPAWIQLVTDNIVAGYPKFLLRIQLLRDLLLAEVLYHEVGHHLQNRIGSNKRGDEGAAEYWSERFSKIHASRHYSYLRLVRFILKPALRLWLRLIDALGPSPKTGTG